MWAVGPSQPHADSSGVERAEDVSKLRRVSRPYRLSPLADCVASAMNTTRKVLIRLSSRRMSLCLIQLSLPD